MRNIPVPYLLKRVINVQGVTCVTNDMIEELLIGLGVQKSTLEVRDGRSSPRNWLWRHAPKPPQALAALQGCCRSELRLAMPVPVAR
jgi:hypothetical protein